MDKVLLVRLEDALPFRQELLDALPPARKEKALRYRKEEDQVRSAVASLLMGMFVSLEELKVTPSGKPYVEGDVHFNVSHSGAFIGIYVSEEEVGFDIERIDRCDLKIVPAAFTEEEARDIVDQKSLAYAWTRKEALSKCQGDGIRNPRSVGASFVAKGQYLYQNREYFVAQQEIEGHIIALAKGSRIEPFDAEFINAPELVKRQNR